MKRKARMLGAYWHYRKHIYITYVNNIWSDSVYPCYEGLPIVPSGYANKEMFNLGVDAYDVQYVLENGYDCSAGRRKKEIIERCLDMRRKTLRIVAAKAMDPYTGLMSWIVIHVGKHKKVR